MPRQRHQRQQKKIFFLKNIIKLRKKKKVQKKLFSLVKPNCEVQERKMNYFFYLY